MVQAPRLRKQFLQPLREVIIQNRYDWMGCAFSSRRSLDNRTLVGRFLTMAGASFAAAENGKEAIAKIEEQNV